jgi:DNA polymerase-4
MSAEWPEGARAVLHVDMDAFYASIEQRDRLELRGKPVVVGGPKDARGVVAAASYEARRFGVRSAMPLRTAARLCPHGVFLPVRMARYLEVSRAVFSILDRFSPVVEPLSVDEAFLDPTGGERLLGGPVSAGRAIRAAVRAELGLTCSVGVAPTKFVAKIASDLEKPDALVVVRPEAVESFLAPLPVRRMWGVGARGEKALRAMGVETFADLAACDPIRLRRAFGARADALWALARGEDARPVLPEHAPKSVGVETTFPEDVADPTELHRTLVLLSDRLGARLRREGLLAGRVTLEVRYAPFRTLTRQATLPEPSASTAALLRAALALFEERTPGASSPVRLLGISASRFSGQAPLFTAPGEARARRVDAAVDAVRARYGAGALGRGSVVASARVGRSKEGRRSGGRAEMPPRRDPPASPWSKNVSLSPSASSPRWRASRSSSRSSCDRLPRWRCPSARRRRSASSRSTRLRTASSRRVAPRGARSFTA